MSIDRKKITQYIVIFLAVILFFTLISNKVYYLMTPEVICTSPQPNRIGYDIYARGEYRDGVVTFPVDLTKEALIEIGDRVSLKFENIREQPQADVTDKTFDEERQMVTVTAAVASGDTPPYNGQYAEVAFFYLNGNYPAVLPKEAIRNEGGETFVYVVRTVNSVLGDRQVVNRRAVTVLDQDEFNAAINENEINNYETVVHLSTKPLRNEAAVRVVQ